MKSKTSWQEIERFDYKNVTIIVNRGHNYFKGFSCTDDDIVFTCDDGDFIVTPIFKTKCEAITHIKSQIDSIVDLKLDNLLSFAEVVSLCVDGEFCINLSKLKLLYDRIGVK